MMAIISMSWILINRTPITAMRINDITDVRGIFKHSETMDGKINANTKINMMLTIIVNLVLMKLI